MEGAGEGTQVVPSASLLVGGVHVSVLFHDVFYIDVPQPSDGVGHHEAPYKLGITVGYAAGHRTLSLLGSHVLSTPMISTSTSTSYP